ncbi:hypothetical protein Hanom_Chr16g01504271 [Helianthus anomalus]
MTANPLKRFDFSLWVTDFNDQNFEFGNDVGKNRSKKIVSLAFLLLSEHSYSKPSFNSLWV